MKSHRRFLPLFCALCLLLATLSPAASAADPGAVRDTLTILFTHDTHDHFLPDAADTGGYTRLATLLRERRAAASGSAVITLDAGDFSMGSLFQTVYATDAPELRALGAMGYDAVTLGNHEFDYRQRGLADMLGAAKAGWNDDHPGAVTLNNGATAYVQYGDSLPRIVQANYTTPKDPSDPAAQALVQALADYPVTDYTVFEKPMIGRTGSQTRDRTSLRIAVFGVMGVDSDECAPMSGMVLEPLIDAAKRVVADIQAREDPDYIICLSHAGTEDGKGEDYELAKAVDGIDVIVSGHTHTTLAEPIRVNDTLIVSCGAYTRNLGALTVGREGGDGPLAVSSYQLLPIDGAVAEDPDMLALADRFKEKVDRSYLSRYGLGFDEALATSQVDFTIPQTGDLIGEAYISTVRELEGDAYAPIAFAVVPDGVVRGTVRRGGVTTADAFDILSLGSGPDGSPGYPLISVYLTGRDLKNAFEVDASISALMPAATLYGAGCHWTYDPRRMFLDRVTGGDILTSGVDGEIQDDRLYRVVADLYSGQMLSTVRGKSFGLLSITPRDENGNEVTDFEARILHDADGREVKAWYAFASCLRDAGDELAPVPSSKTVVDSWSPAGLLFPMGAPTAGALLVLLLLAAAVVLIVRRLRKRKRPAGYRPYRG